MNHWPISHHRPIFCHWPILHYKSTYYHWPFSDFWLVPEHLPILKFKLIPLHRPINGTFVYPPLPQELNLNSDPFFNRHSGNFDHNPPRYSDPTDYLPPPFPNKTFDDQPSHLPPRFYKQVPPEFSELVPTSHSFHSNQSSQKTPYL